MLDLIDARRRMVDRQIRARGVQDERVLQAMLATPREAFLPPGMEEYAYDDAPLPIGAGQTISQPYIVARMIEAAEIKPGDRVLEIGAGSGYAAAVMGVIADHVYTIERHPPLADAASHRLQRLGYSNVEVRTGDGSGGWPEAAPFDAILAAAAAPSVPETLKRQLAIGGRLVMPIGEIQRRQHLVKLTRLGPNEFAQEELGCVAFVPLIGEHGWRERGRSPSAPTRPLSESIRRAAEPLPDFDDPAFGTMFGRFASARVVLLGEASHGTSEFYRARAAITRRLIVAHGFNIVAVEADWPDAASIDRHVRMKPARKDAPAPFTRFPTWMWRNTDFQAFTEWLRAYNCNVPSARRAGFYGLDLYNLNGSIRAVIDYLDRVDPEAASVARQRYSCFTPWSNEPAAYGRMALSPGFARCEQPVVAMLRDLLEKQLEYSLRDSEEFLDAAQNARLIQSAETYYREMYHGSAESWNLRDKHMFETLARLLEFKGPDAKAVIWAHNSHIGDARFTEMGWLREELNLGQLCRERFGRDAHLIGFGTHAGTVAAAEDWDGPMQVMRVNPSLANSYERASHDTGIARFILDLREDANPDLREALSPPRLERFIGVIYRPDIERFSHYSSASLPRQFDAYVWFDESEAVTPLPTVAREGAEKTYPFGL